MAASAGEATVEVLTPHGVWLRGKMAGRPGPAGNTVWDVAFENGEMAYGVSLGSPNVRFVKPLGSGDKRTRASEEDDETDEEAKRSREAIAGGVGSGSSWNPALRWGDPMT
jgi:hypothetical protein